MARNLSVPLGFSLSGNAVFPFRLVSPPSPYPGGEYPTQSLYVDRISAIKWFRGTFGVSVAEAKNVIDQNWGTDFGSNKFIYIFDFLAFIACYAQKTDCDITWNTTT